MFGSDQKRTALGLAVMLICGLSGTQLFAQSEVANATSQLPGGASSLRETFQDWQIDCGGAGGVSCVLTQQQRHQETGQLVLAAELVIVGADSVSGAFVMPFGLKVTQGVTIQVDETAVSSPVPFSTCVPVGCIVPVSFDSASLARLRAGSAAKVTAFTDEGGQEIAFSISLLGFSGAVDRIRAITGQ